MLFYFNAIKGKPFLLLFNSLHKHKQLSSQPLKLTEIQRKKFVVVMKLILNSRLLKLSSCMLRVQNTILKQSHNKNRQMLLPLPNNVRLEIVTSS